MYKSFFYIILLLFDAKVSKHFTPFKAVKEFIVQLVLAAMSLVTKRFVNNLNF